MIEDHGGLMAKIAIDRPAQPHQDIGFHLDLAFSIDPGETVALLGPNGAGKSTTVQLLAGLLSLDRGQISLGGRVLDRAGNGADQLFVPPENRHIGVVFQDYLLFDHLSVLDNVAFGPVSRGTSRREAKVSAAKLLELVGLSALAGSRPTALSGGQAQRVALARALATEPDLLLLDEPLSALDVTTRVELRAMLTAHLALFEGPILLISHDPAEAFGLADRILVLEDGRLTQAGTVDEIRRRPASRYAAALTGVNTLTGVSDRGAITLDDSRQHLQTFDRTSGSVQVTIDPRAVAVYRRAPEGSPRNSWSTTIEAIEPLGDIMRLQLGAPLPLLADITPGAVSDLSLKPGQTVWVSIKATEVLATKTGDDPEKNLDD